MLGWAGCEKLPFTEVHAAFTLADAAHFAEEDTLFVFYRLEADQGLGPQSQLELTYRTDDGVVPWSPLSALAMVHTHLGVDCGPNSRCGSASVRVTSPPRDVRIRLRYHRDGAMFLEAPMALNLVGRGPAFSHRSLVVYGVFDATNRRVQWRARHQFPTVRNEEAQALGLRRFFRVERRGHGELGGLDAQNPYGYGFSAACPDTLTPLEGGALETEARAAFDEGELPPSASASPGVCASSFVTDARGGWVAPALALKNPEVRPAFPALKSPIVANTPIGFVLRPCQRTISEIHESMQIQRLFLEGAEEVCVDDWRAPGFAGTLATRLRQRIDAVRTAGTDMVLSLGLHHDESTGGLGRAVEEALAQVLLPERDKSSPRVSGAFVFDSLAHTIVRPELRPLVLWCPADLGDDLEQISSVSARQCALMPDVPDLVLGPLRINSLPILPTRAQYLTFVGRYGEAQAGKMTSLSFLAPVRTPISQNVALGEFGVVTFFNQEIISAEPSDAFSYCAPADSGRSIVVYRSEQNPNPMPLAFLSQQQQALPESTYALGLAWEFPFLLRAEYEAQVAGQLSALSFSIPFGIKSEDQAYYGAAQWSQGEFSLASVLLQCTRFCDHPTFDSAGVWNAQTSFRRDFASQCYAPSYPTPGAGGFPRDP